MTALTGPCEAILVLPPRQPGQPARAVTCGHPGIERLDLEHRGVIGDIICDEHYADALAGRAARMLDDEYGS